jgi:stearoyl-CoA desaturase (delta-9 desaturase)
LLLLWTPFKWTYLAWLAVTYGIRMFAITAGYHRYFSHRSFKLNRVFQFVLAFLAQASAQMGVLWWAAHHRVHHRNAATL